MSAEFIAFLTELATLSDPIAMHYFNSTTLEIREKQDKTLVTQADLEIETAIRTCVKTQRPYWSILGEEFGDTCHFESKIRLIIDPIDSTQNFLSRIPIFATLLAIEENGEIVAGLVSAPATQERWWAQKGKGSFYNGIGQRVSQVSDLSQAQAFHGSLYGSEATQTPPELLTLLSQTRRQRGMGDYLAHTLVAMGCGDFAVDFGLKPWDIAPLKIIVEEAGGKVTNADGNFSLYTHSIVSSNRVLHPHIIHRLLPV